jgi:hypothetical protein
MVDIVSITSSAAWQRKKHENTDFKRSITGQTKIVQIDFFKILAISTSVQLLYGTCDGFLDVRVLDL